MRSTNGLFAHPSELAERIKGFLRMSELEYNDKNPQPNELNFYIEVDDKASKIKVTIVQTKESPGRLGLVSYVLFSPEHVSALKRISEEEKGKMLNDVFFWLTPREPEWTVELNPKPETGRTDPFYLVFAELFEDEFSQSSLVRSVRKVVKSSMIAKRLIQFHLNKYVEIVDLSENKGEINV